MATTALTNSTFEEAVRVDGIVLVDFWASWCGPCRMFSPVFEKASNDHLDIVFGKVDTEAEQALAAAADIRSIPTLMVSATAFWCSPSPERCPRLHWSSSSPRWRPWT